MLKLWSAPERISHHIVGIVSSVRHGDPERAATVRDSVIPRAGSLMNIAAIAQRSPGIPATKNAARQPHVCATKLLTRYDSAIPIGSPSMKTDIARARRAGGEKSPINEVAA